MQLVSKLIMGIMIGMFVAFIQGIVLSFLWNWFVASTFHITMLSKVEAAGIMTIYTIVRLQIREGEKTDTSWEGIFTRSLTLVLLTLIVWLWGGILHAFM